MKTAHDKLDLLRLARSENIGKITFFRLIEIFGSAKTALEQIPDQAKQGGLRRDIKICSESEAQKEFADCEKFGAQIISFFDEEYPRLLRAIPDPSPILTVKGDADFFNQDSIAIVGPRNASFNAIAFARKLALDLGQNSIITVSGMARGVDAAAHEASLLSGTIGVIAGGINDVYPKENAGLYDEMAKIGLLVSENKFGSPPKSGNFVQRNRLISGLSLGVVVVEASLQSGSLLTAKFAEDQGREVFAVPGSPFDARSRGTNRLIKDGAKMVQNSDDVLSEISALKSKFKNLGMLHEPDQEPFKHAAAKIPSDADIKKIREEIFERLSFAPIAIEEIIEHLQAPARLVNIALVQLELANKINVTLGKVTLKNSKNEIR
jgi:DNA processing protein